MPRKKEQNEPRRQQQLNDSRWKVCIEQNESVRSSIKVVRIKHC